MKMVDPETIRADMERIQRVRKYQVRRSTKYFEYLVVIDFEATCCSRDNTGYCQEIIQFPAVLVDTENLVIVDEFCEYVKPKVNPNLTEYCTNLTGITQDMVQNALTFPEALKRFEAWLLSHEIGSKYTFTIVTDGSDDMGKFFYQQCQLSDIEYPKYAYRWMNLRKAINILYKIKSYNLKMMVEILGGTFHGRPHNGSDDALNIANLVISFIKDGGDAIVNERILLDTDDQVQNGKIIQQKGTRYALETVQGIPKREFVINRQLLNKAVKSENYLARDEIEKEFDERSSGSPWKPVGKENINTDDVSSSVSMYPPLGPEPKLYRFVCPPQYGGHTFYGYAYPNHGPSQDSSHRVRYPGHSMSSFEPHVLAQQCVPPQQNFHHKSSGNHSFSRRQKTPLTLTPSPSRIAEDEAKALEIRKEFRQAVVALAALRS